MKFNGDGYLEPGIHDYDAPEIEAHLVDGFPTSTTRMNIWSGYTRHCADVQSCGLQVVEFLNGSFSSLKNDPSDIDLVGFADMDQVNNLPPAVQAAFASLFDGPGTKTTHMCDAYFVPTVPPGHPLEGRLRTTRKYWMGEFGFDRQDKPKGIIRTVVG
jgi:hypothetical protein